MKRYSRVLFSLILCIIFLLPGCQYFSGGRETHPPKDAKVATCEPGQWGGRLKLALSSAPLTFNPFVASTADTYEVTSKLFGTLLDYDYANQKFANPPNGLARSIDSLPDGRTFIINLRDGASFSNGNPVTADDVIFSFQAAMDNRVESIYGDLMRIDGKYPTLTKENNLTLRITFADHYEPASLLFAKLPIVSKLSLNEALIKGNFKNTYGLDTSPDSIVCSGPFVLKSYTQDKQVDLDYNRYYWKVDSSGISLPYLDGVTYFLKTTREAQGVGFPKNEFHAVQLLQRDFNQFKDNQRFVVRDLGPSLHTWQLVLNWRADPKKIDPTRLTWFRTPAFRWALSSVVDRNRLVKEVFNSMGRPIYNQMTPDNTTWYNNNFEKYDYNPVKAKDYLTKVKYQYTENSTLKDVGGRTVRFTIMHLDEFIPNKIAQQLVEDFKKLGIQIELDPKDYKTFWRLADLGLYDAILLESTPMFSDPAFLQPYLNKKGQFFWFYEPGIGDTKIRGMVGSTEAWMDRVSDKMNEALKKVLLPERREIYNQVQAEWADKAPIIYLANENVVVAAQSTVGNFRPAPLDPALTWNIEEFFLKN
jgi:peptide/nickel transport system substrate-binding protein